MEERIDQIPRTSDPRNRNWMRRIGIDRLFQNPLARYLLFGLFAAGIVIAAVTLIAAVMVVDWS